jgi:signal transduction histidine kinase
MKLLNKTSLYLTGSFIIIIGVWAVLFYISMLTEIYDSIDDGLGNYKILIIDKAKQDSTILTKSEFGESNYAIKKISAHTFPNKDRYTDTLMYMQNEEDFEPVRMLHTYFIVNNQHYQLRIISSMIEEDDLIQDLLLYLIILYCVIIVSIILLNNFVLKAIWKPFHLVLNQVRSFRLNELKNIEPPHTSIAEFKYLNQSLVSLLKNNIDTYHSQKQFIENASHELQTPLAVCINKIELLLEDIKITEDQVNILGTVLENLERLTRLNRTLHLISTIENKQYLNPEVVKLNSIIYSVLDDLNEVIQFNNIRVEIKEMSDFTVKMNRDLALILVSNIIKNAVIHNQTGGRLIITVDDHEVIFANSGNSTTLDMNLIFKRFYKASPSRTSTGLGLSIIKAITDLTGISIEYNFRESTHRFTMRK